MNRLRPISLALLLLLSLAAGAQNPYMCTSNNEVVITFDPGRIWDYNRYEGSRWGFGMGVEFPWRKDVEKPLAEQRRVSVDGWFGYGVRDKRWKYGLDASVEFPHGLVDKVFAGWKDDLEAIGSRLVQNHSVWEVWDNPGFFTSRFARVQRLTAGLEGSTRNHQFGLSYRFGIESFDNGYWAHDPSFPYRLSEVRLSWTLRKVFTLDLIAGHNLNARRSNYLRALAQYSQRYKEHKWGQFAAFAQAGYATLNAPPQRHFDLSGTYDAPLYFRHTFLTVEPDSYLCDAFALGFLTYYSPAFYHTRISNPRLFLQAGAAIGTSFWGYPAPDRGLAELGLGIDRIIRWGILDFGVAAACQLTPESRFSILSVATLIFENP